MFTNVKLARTPARVKPELVWQRGNQLRRVDSQRAQAAHRGNLCGDLNHSNRPMRTRMPGGVGGDRSAMTGPYPDGRRERRDAGNPF